jgi:hypothetical protein
MRVTLPLRLALRTPACPGFGVSGDRKRACFDRYCGLGVVSAERCLPDLSRGWDLVGVDGATHREGMAGRGFERVQMSGAGGPVCAEAVAGMGGPLSIERVQMGWGSGVRGPWEPCPLGSFERVQMPAALALCVARESRAIAARVVKALWHSVAAQPSRLRLMNAVSHTLTTTGERLCHP